MCERPLLLSYKTILMDSCFFQCVLGVGKVAASRINMCVLGNLWFHRPGAALDFTTTWHAIAKYMSMEMCYADVDADTYHIVKSALRLCGVAVTFGSCLDVSSCAVICGLQGKL